MFTAYASKPIIRNAVKIKPAEVGNLYQVSTNTYRYGENGEYVDFTASQTPQVGDYIVRISAEDTYHVPAQVFIERNTIPDSE